VSIEGFKGAVDTMEKVKAVQDYIKRRRGQSKAELVTQNMVAAERLRIVRDIGYWLKKYLADPGDSKNKYQSGLIFDKENIFWLDDLEITLNQSADWQKAASITDEQFENWLSSVLDIAVKNEIELYLKYLLQYVKGKPEKDNINESLNPHEIYRKYLVEFGKRNSEGNISQGEFVREKDEWLKTQKCGETIMRQGGELF